MQVKEYIRIYGNKQNGKKLSESIAFGSIFVDDKNRIVIDVENKEIKKMILEFVQNKEKLYGELLVPTEVSTKGARIRYRLGDYQLIGIDDPRFLKSFSFLIGDLFISDNLEPILIDGYTIYVKHKVWDKKSKRWLTSINNITLHILDNP